MFTNHTVCRACGYGAPLTPEGIKANAPTGKLESVFSLGVQPLANDWRKLGQERAGYAPLEVLLCPECNLAQLSVVVDPGVLYRDYPYVTSPSETMKEHFTRLWNDVSGGHAVESVLEIGSNDGTLLAWLRDERGVKTLLGIEPASNLACASRKRGVFTESAFFTAKSAREWHQPDVILARHVLCHVDDWRDFFRGIETLCRKDTLVCIENPYVADMLAANSFDQIYHEHLSYLSIRSIEAVLKGTNLHLHQINHYPIHGGAIALLIRHNDWEGEPDASVIHALRKEDVGRKAWARFEASTAELRFDLADAISEAHSRGQTVAALGASAKSTVWINACGFTKKDIAWIADSTVGKWYTTVPGTEIPVVDEGAILREMPDYVVMFCWNYVTECLQRNALAREQGVKFIIPIPKVEIV